MTDLDRLAASMHIRRTDVTRRTERYGRVLESIERGDDLSLPTSVLQLDEAERAQTRSLLDSDVYTVIRIRLFVLLRLDSVLSSGGASYDHPLITVEHVLPQNPPADSLWHDWFTAEQRTQWVHRLANLVLLTRKKNSEASNREFQAKKTRYFTGPSGVSPFVLTTQVLQEPTWTPDHLQQRQSSLLAELVHLWRL